MRTFPADKLLVEYRNGVTATNLTLPRKYTLTHSDDTGELFLTIGTQFAWDQVNRTLRDEVLGNWHRNGYFEVFVTVDQGEHALATALKRTAIFKRELPLALMAIRYGDRFLFEKYPNLDSTFILVHFLSAYPQLASQDIWGTFDSYKE